VIFGMLKERLKQGHQTIALPAQLSPAFRGRPALDPSGCGGGCHACADVCPTGAVTVSPLSVDLGKCLFCPACSSACPNGAIRSTADYRLAARERGDLVIKGGEPVLASALERRTRKLFGRALRLRQVSAGGCSGCEVELNATGNIQFDLSRFGVQFVASPRHADCIVITGPVTVNMRQALIDTYAATPSPRLVIAVGACAISGGVFAGSREVLGIPAEIPIDLYVPGCPPHPLSFMDGVLRMLGKLG
jgi:Ni,Fe-hydrogenase III small subunit/NAD-dependent dihydropyrimidine dehydrogenase PreA subunit